MQCFNFYFQVSKNNRTNIINETFYNISIILIFVTFFLSCLNLKSISDTSHQYYPYYYYGKWGFNNDSGDCVIKPQFDTVMFLVKDSQLQK